MNEKKPVELKEEETKQVVGGATAVEYGLIAANIGVAIISSVTALGPALANKFTQISSNLKK
jgi:pilus assembly protein Flp/PilA